MDHYFWGSIFGIVLFLLVLALWLARALKENQ
jgi:hypothetical protein